MKKNIPSLLLLCILMINCMILYAQDKPASEWAGALTINGEVYKASFTIWNHNGQITGVADYPEEKSYNNKIDVLQKGDSLLIYRYSKKDPSKMSSILRGVTNGKLYNGIYTGISGTTQGAFAFSLNEDPVVKQQAVPELTFRALGKNNSTLSLADRQGKYLLVDFWATYCATCIPKRKELDSVYTKYKDVLTITSISLDKDPMSVETFRNEKFAMPWKHACVSGDFDAAICKVFGVDKIGTPALFLISPDGILLAKTNELLGRGIDAVLAASISKK